MSTTDTDDAAPYYETEDGMRWTHADDRAAYLEGWGIWECGGSLNGPFQVQKFDSGDENGDGIPEHAADTDAWEVMGYGRLPHHRHALYFLAVANPMEHLAIARWCTAVEIAAMFA